ncbi:phage terminase large subunit family protein [Myxococcota bacterium]|nr:phage terminase large subunit family protein [Myxococcota bacterium]
MVLDRGKFTFERHEYLEEPYQDEHPCQVEMKSTQMGNTTRAVLRMFYWAMFLDFVGVLYLFPTKGGSGDFASSRIDPLTERNPFLAEQMRSTDSKGMKRFAGCNLIFRGTRSEEGLRSDPCDGVIYDERDLMPDWAPEAARGRLGHSDYKYEHSLSNPTLPDYGIDAQFQLSDQRYWLLKCPKCGGYTCMEDHWAAEPGQPPDCLVEWKGEVVRLCMSCRDAVLHPAQGLWVAKRPDIQDVRGRHYSQLWSQYHTPADILKNYQTTKRMDRFYNYCLGLPYVDAANRLSIEEVLKLCGTAGLASSDGGPCAMGVDQGKGLHVVIGKPRPNRLVHLGEYLEWGELDDVMRLFNVQLCVVDGMPETRSARDFAKRHPGKVFLCWYNDNQKVLATWHEDKLMVVVNRTESMDDSHTAVRDGELLLPRECEPVKDFAQHCHNTAKTLEENEETGGKRYRWVKLGADHYRHGWNYCKLALDRILESFFGGSDLS